MVGDDALEPIRTARLELVPISPALIQALVGGDLVRASMILGAAISRSLARDPSHVTQLALAQASFGAPKGGGRVVVLAQRATRRRAIGSIGFHGPPDDRGRLEVGCRIHPAHRGRGYTGEAMAAMFEWAATRLGIARFLVAVSSQDGSAPRLVTELELSGGRGWGDRIAELEGVLDPLSPRRERPSTSQPTRLTVTSIRLPSRRSTSSRTSSPTS
jgi:[ribosomal protein S5]-alanine N-acetyltransferase